MASSADGSVVIEIDLTAKEAEQELSRLKKKILRLNESLYVGEHKKNSLVAQLKEAEQELDNLQKKTTIGPGFSAQIDPTSVERISELKNIISSTTDEIKKQEAANKRVEETLYAEKNLYGETEQVARKAADEAEKLGNNEGKNRWIESYKIGVQGLAKWLLTAEKNAISLSRNLAKSFYGKISGGIKKLTKSFLTLFTATKKSNNAFSGGFKNLLKYGLGIRSVFVLVNRLRAALVDGFKNLAQFSTETNTSISMVKSALTQLKNSLATAFTPILTVVAPILTQFINMLSKAADYVARLTAALTGQKSYTKATAVQEDYAASLKDTSGAAKDASKALANFDTINKLSTNSSASSGGGSVTPSEMFEEVSIEPLSFDSWGEAFSTMVDSILNDGIPRLESGLSTLADWINGFSANVAEMFTFPDVQEKIYALGASVATSLNNFVNQVDWVTMGSALGAGLNTALSFMVSFLYTFDWLGLGNSLSTLVNNAIENINWYNLGKLLWAKFKAVIETAAGFLLGLDMKSVAKAASNTVIGFFDSMSETIQSIDWGALAEQIITLLVNIDWAGMIASAAGALGSLAGALANFIGTAIASAFDGIIEYFSDEVDQCGGNIVLGILKGILDGLVGIATWIYDNIFVPFIDGFKAAFGIHSPSTVMAEQGSFLMSGLLSGLTNALQPVIDFFSRVKKSIQDVLSDIIKFVKNVFTGEWESAWDGVKSVFKNLWNDIVGLLESAVNLIIQGVNWMISKLNTISFETPDWVPGIGGKSFGINIPAINEISIPRLAQGAVIPPNREFLAVLGDQKQGTNIEAPASEIEAAVARGMQSGNGIYGGQLTITIKPASGLTRYLSYELDDESKRRGYKLVKA